MAIPSFDKKYLAEAIKYIDENGVPERNLSTKYELVWKNGNKYPPKYVIAVAHHLSSGSEIDITTFNAVEAKGYFESRGYTIESKQQKFELIITADNVISTDESFAMDNLGAGNNFKPLDASFVSADGNGSEDTILFMNSGSTYENNVKARENVCIIKHGLNIPTCASCYNHFSLEMQKSEMQFKNEILKYAEKVCNDSNGF